MADINCDEPKIIIEVLNSENNEKLKAEMEDKYNSITKNETLELTTLPPGRKTIQSKLIST